MDQARLLIILSDIGVPDRYWEAVEYFDQNSDSSVRNKREEISRAFRVAGVDGFSYVARGGFLTPDVLIGGVETHGMLSNTSSSLEMIFSGMTAETHHYGGGFANMAYAAKQLSDPTYSRSRFEGPKPYPRPGHQKTFKGLVELAQYFSEEIKRIQSAVRAAIEER